MPFPSAYRYDLAAALLAGVFEGLTAPFLGVVARQWGATIWQVALIASIPFYGHLLALFWLSRRVHFASPLAYVAFATSITRVLFLGMAWVTSPAAFVACACLAQFLAPVHGPAYTEVMREIYPEEIRGKAMGSVRMASSVATMLAATLGGKLLDLLGFRVIFPAAAIAGVGAAWIFSQIPYPRYTPKEREVPLSLNFLELLSGNSALRRFEGGMFLFGFGNLMIVSVVPVMLVDRFYVTNFFVGQLAFVTSLARLFSLYFWGHRIDRGKGLSVAGELLILMAFVSLCYAAAAGPSAQTPWKVLLVAASAISGCAVAGLELVVISSMIELSHGRDPSLTMALHQTILGIRGITAPLVGTFLLAHIGLQWTFLASASFILAGSVLVRRLESRPTL